MPPTTIRKALVHSYGDASHITVVDADIAPPPPNHVQVRVIYSGFSGADINMRLGRYPMQRKSPLTPGYCLVGTVEINGQGSSKFGHGDIVACLSIYDAEAQLANMPEKYLIKVPVGIDLKQATALVLDWNTAYGMVMHSAQVTGGQRVFVHGMSGAVGYAIMTLCMLSGAEVYGTCSERNHAAMRDLGATPFTYRNKNWMTEMNKLGGAHVVFDALGFESWDESWEILSDKDGGLLLGYGGNLPTLTGQPDRSVVWPTIKLMTRGLTCGLKKKGIFYYITRDQQTFAPDLDALFQLCAQGKIRVPVKQIFDLEDIQEAHRSWGKGSGIGSTLIRIGQEPV